MEAVKPDPIACPTGSRQQGREAGEEFEIDNRIDPLLPCPTEEVQGIEGQDKEVVVTQGKDMLRRDGAGQVEAGTIIGKDEEKEFRLQLIPGLTQGGIGQDGGSHLGQLDKEDPAWPDLGTG